MVYGVGGMVHLMRRISLLAYCGDYGGSCIWAANIVYFAVITELLLKPTAAPYHEAAGRFAGDVV